MKKKESRRSKFWRFMRALIGHGPSTTLSPSVSKSLSASTKPSVIDRTTGKTHIKVTEVATLKEK